MKSPVRFMARGLAEAADDENPRHRQRSNPASWQELDRFVAEPIIGPAERPDPLTPRNDEALQRRRRLRRQRRRWPQRARRLAPGAGVAARDHPVNDARNDSGPGHDFEMPPDDAVETQRRGVERNQTEIAGESNKTAADRVGQRAPDVKRFSDRGQDHRRQQRKTTDEDKAEAEHD